MSKWAKAAAAGLAAVAVVILAYALLTPQENSDTTDHMGMGWHMSYSSGNVGLIAVAVVTLVAALMFIFLWQEYEPLPLSYVPPAHKDASGLGVQPSLAPPLQEAAGPRSEPANEEEQASRDYLVLRLLTGDERLMYKALMDSGGWALQKDLILSTKMSNAKVSRVLDRLGQKGLVDKERFGSTNKITIKHGH